MQTIYLETSIICHLTDPPSINPITHACQQVTRLWWKTRCDPSRTFVSEHVHNEIKGGDPLRAIRRLQAIENLVSHPVDPGMRGIEELLFFGGGLKTSAHWAASHIAHRKCSISQLRNSYDLELRKYRECLPAKSAKNASSGKRLCVTRVSNTF